MRLDLASRWSRVLFLLLVAFLAAMLAFPAVSAWRAESWTASSRPQLWRKAARWEPTNAAPWIRLGLDAQMSLAAPDPRQAILYFHQAAQIDPRSAETWLDLAAAYEEAGEPAHAQNAYQRAEAAYPISADVAWRYGSFLLRARDASRACPQLRKALTIQPSLAMSAVSEYWQLDPNIAPLLDSILPADARDYVAALNFFLSQGALDPALAVWNRLAASGLRVPMPDALPLVAFLIAQNRLPAAERVWSQALSASDWPRDPAANASLVFNGGFERDSAGAGFDWREIPAPGFRFAFDRQVFHSGSRSLRVAFDGTANLDFANLAEYVPVEPRTPYRFTAWLRTAQISTDSGIRFQLLDPRHHSDLQLLTPGITGTAPWTRVQFSFTTGPRTDLLEISLRRIPSWKFDNKLNGTVWVDDVALTPVPSPPRRPSK